MRRSAILIALSAIAVSCARAPTLVPAPGARVVADQESMAYTQAAGVAIWADGDAWDASPRDLERVVTPVWIHMENRSRRPIRVEYKNFQLIDAGGFRQRALTPFHISRAEGGSRGEGRLAAVGPSAPQQRVNVHFRTGTIARPRIYHRRFYVAPHYRYIYGPRVGVSVWDDPWRYDYFYYDRYYRWSQPLPTRDMIRRALPEGVIDPGGGVGGFVYFQSGYPVDGRVLLQVDLLDADSGQKVGEARIPFVVHR